MGAPNTLYRRCVGRGQCDWCGRWRERVFRYGGERTREFCNVECAGTYHGFSREDYDYIEPEVRD